MPYRNAHYFVGFVLLVIVSGFWASYFSVANAAPLAFHVHAISSMTWLALLIIQHVAIHRRANALHRQVGKASFVLFPFLILGFAMIINVSAERFAARESEFIAYLGPSFGIGMMVAICAYITVFYLALKHRRKVKLHAGYMLATPLILFESPFSRVMNSAFPWMNVIGSEGLHGLLDSIVVSNALAIAFAIVLYFRDRKHGTPWLVAAGFMLTQSILMWFGPSIPAFTALFDAYTAIPQAVTLLVAIVAGAATAWFGWQAGKPPRRAMSVAT